MASVFFSSAEYSMNKQEIFEIIKRNIAEVLPDVDGARVQPDISLRDLGANSIDRADILIQTMESLRLKFPLHELGSVKNLGGLVDFLHAKLSPSPGSRAA
jgi:polyketide biosynthesis acyl carrier protein